jgi:serine/threonine protein kinase
VSPAAPEEKFVDLTSLRFLSRHLQYIAPEAISSRKAIASTVDIFSWGMTAYEMLKGKGWEGTESDEEPPEFFRAIHMHSTRTMSTLTSLCPSMPPELSGIIKKALALDPDERYINVCGLLHDLQKVAQICDGSLRGNARREFSIGQIDRQSRFAVPPGLLDREDEFAMLEEAYQIVKSTGKSQVACCWGMSGSGKSKLLELWARQKESDNAGQDCFVSWAKVSLCFPVQGTVRESRFGFGWCMMIYLANGIRDVSSRWTSILSSHFPPSFPSFAHCSNECLAIHSNPPRNGDSVSWTRLR